MRRTINHVGWGTMYPGIAPQPGQPIPVQVQTMFPNLDPGTHGSVCANLLRQTMERANYIPAGGAARERLVKRCMNECDGMVNSVLVYKTQSKPRVPDSMENQRAKFRRNLFAVYSDAKAFVEGQQGSTTASQAAAATTGLQQPDEAVSDNEPTCVTCGRKVGNPTAIWYTAKQQCGRCYQEKRPAPKAENQHPVLAHRDWSQSARAYCESRAADGSAVWDWGMRNAIDGAAIILAAMQAAPDAVSDVSKAVRDACTMHLDDDVRQALGVTEPFDFTGFGVPKYLDIVAKARVPLPKGKVRSVCAMMVGPMGSGKSTAAEQLADDLGIPYGTVSMTRGTSPTAFNGKQRVTDDGKLLAVLTAIAEGQHEQAKALADEAMAESDVTVSQWVKIYSVTGGVFHLSEIDAADSNLLLIVNEALASAGFANSATGKIMPRHPDFIGVASANTVGLGANSLYGGRERLDAASLDRWAPGRVRVGYDNALESSIVEGMIA